MEAIGSFIAQSPGCRQGAILVPGEAWRQMPGSGAVWPWDILDRRRDPWSRRAFVVAA